VTNSARNQILKILGISGCLERESLESDWVSFAETKISSKGIDSAVLITAKGDFQCK
jgi:hypothetical protein